MTWARLDDKFPRHRKVRRLQRDIVAKWVHVTAICFCCEHLTDGYIDEIDLEQIINDADVPPTAATRAIPKLIDAGLWISHEDGRYEISDFLDYNPTSASVKAKRESAKERMRALRSLDVRANETRSSHPVREPQSPAPAQTPKDQLQLLDREREIAAERLLERISGADDGTPKVVHVFCKQLPKDRIDRVTSTLRVGVKPAIAVSALKREVQAYEREVAQEGVT